MQVRDLSLSASVNSDPIVEFDGPELAFPKVCVTSRSASGRSAAEYLGKTGHTSPKNYGSSLGEYAFQSNELSNVTSGSSAKFPRDTLPRVFKRQRQIASSTAFQYMRRRFAVPES